MSPGYWSANPLYHPKLFDMRKFFVWIPVIGAFGWERYNKWFNHEYKDGLGDYHDGSLRVKNAIYHFICIFVLGIAGLVIFSSHPPSYYGIQIK